MSRKKVSAVEAAVRASLCAAKKELPGAQVRWDEAKAEAAATEGDWRALVDQIDELQEWLDKNGVDE